jgi:hypothetical protein
MPRAEKNQGHPDICPNCKAPISVDQRRRMNEALPCTCPVGFGAVADVNCPRHSATAKHTISGLANE